MNYKLQSKMPNLQGKSWKKMSAQTRYDTCNEVAKLPGEQLLYN